MTTPSVAYQVDGIVARIRREREARAEVCRRVSAWRRRRAAIRRLQELLKLPGLLFVGALALGLTTMARWRAR
jgi:hypothetical protein